MPDDNQPEDSTDNTGKTPSGKTSSGKNRRRRRAAKKKNADTPLTERLLHQRVRTAKGRKGGSTRWLQRQLNDPYVAAARRHGYRSRAAFKLLEIDERFGVITPGATVLDLGAAPGSWTQVVLERLGISVSVDSDGSAVTTAAPGNARVVGVDILPMEALPGATWLTLDIEAADAPECLHAALPEGVDLVLSDMAPNATGHKRTDHLRIMALVEAAVDIAGEMLRPGGCFVAKVWQGGAEHQLLHGLKTMFAKVRHVKPGASRPDSAEIYLVAEDFKGSNAFGGDA